MKTLAKISLLVAGLAAASVPAFSATPTDATTPAPAGKRAHLRGLLAKRQAKVRAHVAKRLDLTAEQKTQLKAKRDELKQSLKAVKDDASLTKEQKRTKVRELVQAERGQMRAVLTADQQAKLDQMREKQGKLREHRAKKAL